jgi:hypothetical protein
MLFRERLEASCRPSVSVKLVASGPLGCQVGYGASGWRGRRRGTRRRAKDEWQWIVEDEGRREREEQVMLGGGRRDGGRGRGLKTEISREQARPELEKRII